MEKPPDQKKARPLMWTAIIIITLLITSVLLYRLYYTGAPAQPEGQLTDAKDDVALNIGTEYPGMIDVTNAKLEANGTELEITINVTDPISALGDEEFAQWNVTIVLENDIVKMYEVCAEMNSTRFSSYVAEIGENQPINCQTEYQNNSLTLRIVIDELQNAEQAEWFILTTFDKYSQNELITSGSDIAPDEGLQTTTFKE